MLKEITICFVLAVLCSHSVLQAQENGGPRNYLTIGDTVPDIAVRRMLHYKSPTAKFSDFRGKRLILDFWATWCSPCIYMIPRMDSLQQQFGNSLQFLSITSESESRVALFRNRYDKRHGPRIQHPEVVEDSVLSRLFYHTSVPHYVWIDENGIVQAITDWDQVSTEKIGAFLGKNNSVLKEKIDERRISHDDTKPLLANGNGGDGHNLIYHSLLTGYTPGLKGRVSWNIDPKAGRRITVTNCSRYWLYRIAYAKPGGFLDEGSVIIESQRPQGLTSTLYGQNFLDWLRDSNGFCYELIVPVTFMDKTNNIMQQDLANFFPDYAATMENRKIKCLVLLNTKKQDGLPKASRGGKREVSIDPFGWKLTNASLGHLVEYFNNSQSYALNLIDQTGYLEPVDLDAEGNISDLPNLNKSLARYGLMLHEKMIERQVLVIRDNNSNNKKL